MTYNPKTCKATLNPTGRAIAITAHSPASAVMCFEEELDITLKINKTTRHPSGMLVLELLEQ